MGIQSPPLWEKPLAKTQRVTENRYEPFLTADSKRSATVDLDHTYTLEELRELGIEVFSHNSRRILLRHILHLPLWLFPGMVLDHDDPHEPDAIHEPKMQLWGGKVYHYGPSTFFTKRGYHKNCQICCAKNHFFRFRFVVYTLLALLALAGLCILAWQNLLWFSAFFMLALTIGAIVFIVLSCLVLVWIVTIPGF